MSLSQTDTIHSNSTSIFLLAHTRKGVLNGTPDRGCLTSDKSLCPLRCVEDYRKSTAFSRKDRAFQPQVCSRHFITVDFFSKFRISYFAKNSCTTMKQELMISYRNENSSLLSMSKTLHQKTIKILVLNLGKEKFTPVIKNKGVIIS
jgi:hypothetical protein